MSTSQDSQNSNFKLAQYLNHYQDGYAERLFDKESNINLQFVDSHSSDMIGCTALHLAVIHESKTDIEYLLGKGADPTIKNQKGQTPLHYAILGFPYCCQHPSEQLNGLPRSQSSAELLISAQIKSGNFENPTNEIGLSHFHIACITDNAEAVEFFLNRGISADETISADSPTFPGYTPLHLAAKYSALEATKVLLKFNANTQLKDTQGMTFMCTLLETRAEIVELDNRSKPIQDIETANIKLMNFLLESTSFPIDYAGLTRFHVACSGTKLSIVQRLLQNITDINHAVEVDALHWPGFTALHFAAAYSCVEMVKLLVIKRANMMAKDAKGVTPLDICIDRYKLQDVHAILSLDATWRSILMSDRKTRLLDLIFVMKDISEFFNFFEPRAQIVNTSVPLDSPVWQGYTPLHIAVMFYDEKAIANRDQKPKDERVEYIIDLLIIRGPDCINAQDIRGRTPLHLAYRHKQLHVCEWLLRFLGKIEDIVDDENLSHLHIACQTADVVAVGKILQTTVDVNRAFKGQLEEPRISRGSTPLHCAALNEQITAALLAYGADPLLKDANGMTAIHRSGGNNRVILSVPNLIDCVVADSGLSHLHVAVCCGDLHAVSALLDNGAEINRALLRDDVLCLNNGVQSRAGQTPLDLALFGKDNVEMVGLLMRRGAEVLSKERRVSHIIPETMVLALHRDDRLFKRLEREIGLTMLHVACARRDAVLIEALLSNGADVDARINVKSRLWPGYTALHVVMGGQDHEASLDEIVRLLLDHGADVTLTSAAEGETALHLAHQLLPEDSPSKRYSCMRMILRAHRDFTVDTLNFNSFSFFDIACMIGETDTAKKFLEHGVDVNEVTADFGLCDDRIAAPTPLHLAAGSSEYAMDQTLQLEIVDLLLNYGADANKQDLNGNTALHLMARWNYRREDVILRLIKSKANPNLRNLRDETPLQILITTEKYVTYENSWMTHDGRKLNVPQHLRVHDIKRFLEFGCSFNVFHSPTDKGLIATTMMFIPFEDLLCLITSSIINFPHLMQTDDMGRTVVHNMVSGTNGFEYGNFVLFYSHYITLIEKLGRFDLDVDDTDKLGRTPLHLAVLFRNSEAISGLLKAGSDVNLTDASGKTALSYLFECCARCSENENSFGSDDHKQCNHTNIFLEFAIHINILLHCELDVNEINQHLFREAIEKCNSENVTVGDTFRLQNNKIKSLKIARSKLTLTSFLSETGAVTSYATLPKSDRDSVDEFFKYKISDFRSKYAQVAGILLLQYRKAVKRLELNQPAQFALVILSRLPLPNLCSEAILKYLSNSELSCMIEAAG